MFDNLFKQMGDLDADKLVEVVNLVWNNRAQIMDLIERLPELLDSTGSSIESAGASALKASIFLAGDEETPSAGKISEMAAHALDRCQDEIYQVAAIMTNLSQEIDDIRIPSIKPSFTKVAGFNVVNGLDFGELPLTHKAANRLKGGADRIQEISKDLETVALHLRDLGGTLTDAGKDLNQVGQQLMESGQTLRSLTQWKG